MRRVGSVLMALGVVIGVGTGLAVLGDVHVPGVGSWLVAVAVAKLGFIASFSLIAAGAVANRIDKRRHGLAVDPPRESAASDGSQRQLTAGGYPDEPIQQGESVGEARRPRR